MMEPKPFSTASRIRRSIALALGILSMCLDIGLANVQANETKAPVIAVAPTGGAGSTPLAALIEARLSQNDRYILIEREHLAKIAGEWELSALSAASSVAKRVEIGRLLGANLLVLVAERATPTLHFEVVISETARGLRLRVATLPKTQQPENDARAIEEEIDKALKKQAEGFVGICAVPPFVSMDLSGTHEHLKISYSRMLEAMLLQTPGTLVVEIAEAREIAAETALTGAKVERLLPIYFLGEYRFDAANPYKPPYLRITAQRGEQVIGSREAGDMTTTTAVPFFRKSAMELLEAAVGAELPERDPKVESQTLATRAIEHFSLGYYEEATQLAEASFLLEPRQPELHRMAMSAYGRCLGWMQQSAMEALPYHDQALVHMEQFFLQSHIEKDDSNIWGALTQTFSDTVHMANEPEEEVKQASHAYHRRERDAYLRIIAAKHAEGTLNDVTLTLIFDHWRLEPLTYGESLRDNLRKRLEVALMVLNSKTKNPHWFICELVDKGLCDESKKTAEYSWFLDQLHRLNHPAVKAGLERMAEHKAHYHAKCLASKNSRVKDPVAEVNGPAEIEFVPLDLKFANHRNFTLWGLLGCGPGVDLVWGSSSSGSSAFLMKQKGVLEQVFQGGKNQGFGQATFDGKYAWLPVTNEQSMVLAINPVTGFVMRFTSEDGLPVFSSAASASLGEGRLCFSGEFGRHNDQRSYIAILDLTTNDEKKVRIIHEATRQLFSDEDVFSAQLDPHLSFNPNFMISESKDHGKSWLAMLTRNGYSKPLMIDPDTPEVKVIAADCGSVENGREAFFENEVYWGGSGGLYRLRVDTRKSDRVRDIPEDGSGYERVVIHDGRLHVVGWNWWLADGLDQPFRKLAGKVPGRMYDVRQLFVSSHYGILFRTSSGLQTTYRVVFRDAPPTK